MKKSTFLLILSYVFSITTFIICMGYAIGFPNGRITFETWKYLDIRMLLMFIVIIFIISLLLSIFLFKKKAFFTRIIYILPITITAAAASIFLLDYLYREYPYGLKQDEELKGLSLPHKPCNNDGDYVSLIISESGSYKYDLVHKIYTVNMMDSSVYIPFILTTQEDSLIQKKFYTLCLNNLPDSITFDDNCMIMPKFYVKVQASINNKVKIFEIDTGCEDYRTSDIAKRLNNFIEYTLNIIDQKSEIKNAPKSDIMYM